jgi:hypothetical protein
MKKQILIGLYCIIIVIILSLGVFAGISLSKTDSTISISKEHKDTLATKGISKIEVQSDAMTCDDKECWANVKQDNLIQTQRQNQSRQNSMTYQIVSASDFLQSTPQSHQWLI